MSKTIFIDFDGTLSPDGEYISPIDIEAIHRAQEAGHKAVLTTGRTNSLIYPFIRDIGFDSYILGAGVSILHNEKFVYSKAIAESDREDLIQYLDSTKIPYLLEGEKGIYCHENDYTVIRDEIYKVDEYPHFQVLFNQISTLQDIGDDSIGKATVYTLTKDNYDLIAEHLSNQYTILPLSAKYFGEANAELTMKGLNKGETIKKYCELFNVNLEYTVGIGDSDNDLEMMKTVGIPVAMGNASQSIKDASEYIVYEVGDCGVAEAINRFVLDV
jgi:Cof subfamily protein (haloacid dehalogenase superfamily)